MRRCLYVLGVLILSVPVLALATDPVRELGSPIYSTREQATAALWREGEAARARLERAAASPRPEVAARARTVLARFDAADYPDTTSEVQEQVRQFRAAAMATVRVRAVNQLMARPDGRRALAVLLTHHVPPDQRTEVFDAVTTAIRREVPLALERGEAESATAMVGLGVAAPTLNGAADVSLYHLARGTPHDALAPTAGHPLAEVFAARGTGNAAAALVAASRAEKVNLAAGAPVMDALLEDLGRWRELAARPIAEANSREGLRAFRLVRAQDPEAAERFLDRLTEAPADPKIWIGSLDGAALGLFINGRTDAALNWLRSTGASPHILADVLAARLDFSAALTAAADRGTSPAPNGIARGLAASRRGRIAALMGDKKQAETAFIESAQHLNGQWAGLSALTQLLRLEVQSGRADLAAEHLGRALTPDVTRSHVSYQPTLFEAAFGAEADVAQTLWRTDPTADSTADADVMAASLGRISRLLRGRGTPDEIEAALTNLKKSSTGFSAQDLTRAAAAVYRMHGRFSEARAELEAAVPPKDAPTEFPPAPTPNTRLPGARGWLYGTDESFVFWVELGDALLAEGHAAEAAERLMQGWRDEPNNPILLYLSGHALRVAGDAVRGDARMALSHQVSLGNLPLRARFLRELLDRGHVQAAAREEPLARAAAWPADPVSGNLWGQVVRGAVLRGEFSTAVAATDRVLSHILRMTGRGFVSGGAYLAVPHSARGFEARAALAAGDFAAARTKTADLRAAFPGEVDSTAAIVRGFHAAGQPHDADAIYSAAQADFQTALDRYPESAYLMDALARLAVGSRRDARAAVQFATRAVEREPAVRDYRETLAEAYFRAQDRNRALATMAELQALDPQNHLYRRLAAFYRTGHPTDPLPPAD